MIDQVFQCCYTHVSREQNGAVSTAWMPVAVSPNLPDKLKDFCTRIQSTHSKKVSGVVDENGNTLDLFEICGDGQNVYLIRTRFGGIDFGRANLFSHAYILPWDSMEDKINDFLMVDLSNFAAGEEEALEQRASLTYKPKLTRERALADLGLSREDYITLIRCVYAQMEQKAPQPLYIQYDGTEKQRDALLYCIYSGLPLDLSRRLSMATAPCSTEMQRNIIFSQIAASHSQYIIPSTGENNILVGLAERKIRGLGFVDYAPSCESEAEASAYLEELYRAAKSLAGQLSPNAKTTKIAHQMIRESDMSLLDDAQLEQRLGDALSAKSSSSQYMEAWIADLLGEANKRGMILTDASSEMLMEKFEVATEESFILNIKAYLINRLKHQDIKGANKTLLHADPEMFRLYYNLLIEDESGQALLDVYFAERLKASKGNWDDLHSALADSADLLARPETLEAVRHAAWERYIQELDLPGSKPVVLDAYMDVMRRMVSNPDKLEELSHKAMNAYWATKTLDQFDFGLEDEYNNFAYSTYPITGKYITLNRAKRKLETEGEESCLALINRSIEKYGQNYTEQELNEYRDFICKKLKEVCHIQDRYFSRWMDFALKMHPKKVFEELLEVRDVLKKRRYKKIEDAILEFYKVLSSKTDAEDAGVFMNRLNKLIFVICKEQDSEEEPVPIDTWLYIGLGIRNNDPFRIFNEDDFFPCVMDEEASDVVSSSKYLKKAKFIDFGESYVKEKNASYKIVNRWLKEARSMYKKYESYSSKRKPEPPPFKQKPQYAEDEKKSKSLFGSKNSRFKNTED